MTIPTFFRTMTGAIYAGALAFLAAGCSGENQAGVTIVGADGAKSGALALHIENALGETLVEVDPRLSGPSVEVFVIDPSTGALIESAPKAAGWVGAEQTEIDGKPTLRVLSLHQEGQETRPIFIRIRAPEVRGAYVRAVGGPVRLLGVDGPINVETEASAGLRRPGGASIHVRLNGPLDTPVSLVSDDGDVRLELPGSSRGQVEVTALRRVIELGGHGASVSGAKTSGDKWSGTLNGGSNPVVLRSRAGQAVVRAN